MKKSDKNKKDRELSRGKWEWFSSKNDKLTFLKLFEIPKKEKKQTKKNIKKEKEWQ